MRRTLLTLVFSALAVLPVQAVSETLDITPPARDYYAYVCAESEDEVSLIRFGPEGVSVEATVEVGSFPAEIEGPHGINVSPDGKFFFVSVAHGQPFGSIHKYSTTSHEWEESVNVGMFPATLDVSGTTGLLYVVNADFYGDHKPSSISIIETQTMTEVAQVESGVMPHGARLSRDGKQLYSVNMMDDELVELDALRFEIARRLPLGSDTEAMDHSAHTGHHKMPADNASSESTDADSASEHIGHGAVEPTTAPPTGGVDLSGLPLSMPPMTMEIEPSWVTRPTKDGKIYVAALSGSKVLEVDLESWRVTRSFATPKGPYNVDVTPDGTRMVVTYKKSDSIGLWDLATGEEVARIATTRRIPHGVAITTDGRYSFVTVEGVGGEPGVVEIIDNQAGQRVAQIEIGKQAGGVAIWEP